MKITLTVEIPKLTTKQEAQEYGRLLAEWVVECPLNDDSAITAISSTVHNIEKGTA